MIEKKYYGRCPTPKRESDRTVGQYKKCRTDGPIFLGLMVFNSRTKKSDKVGKKSEKRQNKVGQ